MNTNFERVMNIAKEYTLSVYQDNIRMIDRVIKCDSIHDNIIRFVEFAEKDDSINSMEITSTLIHDMEGLSRGDKMFIPKVNSY
tara:strand:- start:482 stop:733 length:252 start_codon:yes stop_codon:yes gene_type:complete